MPEFPLFCISRNSIFFLCKFPKCEKRLEILKKVVYNGFKW